MTWKTVGCAVMVTLVAATSSFTVRAQGTYRCELNGRMVMSNQPCPGSSTRLQSIGPSYREPTAARPQHLPPPGSVQEHLQYLSPDCAELSEAIRTAPARGVGYATVRDLHAEYRAKCSEDDRLARQKHSEVQSDQRRAERDAREAKNQARAMTQREREQCHEMLRILHGRRQRAASLTPGEQADLQRFEEGYTARCKS